MTPSILLCLLVLLTLTGALAQRLAKRCRQAIFRQLARDWGMHYSEADQLRLGERIAEHFPIPGAASIRVIDLIYGTREHQRHFIFTVDYTLGLTSQHHRRRRAGACIESRSGPENKLSSIPLLGSTRTPLVEQYQLLREMLKNH